MPFTTVGWVESQNTGGVLTNFTALSDPHVRVEGDNVIVPSGMNFLAGVYAGGASITQARIHSPSLSRVVDIDIGPLNVGAEPLSPTPFLDMFENPVELDATEALSALAAGSESTNEYKEIIAWLSSGRIEPYRGPYRTVRATGSTTLNAYEWTNVSLTLAQSLPAGRYQVVGFWGYSAGGVAARLVFPGYPWRPGAIIHDSIADIQPLRFRFGNAGVWGEFTHDSPPSVDFLSVSADTSEVVYLDIVKVG
ncbi:MAG: hypothetical protein ONB06_12065 [candidate division KSB1 bacterium]|nr:hypothetical protein [candidate division KSB1 bacterium]